ncbi:MAG: leucyl aminopeptidase [Endozoicomonadaceae bacterium]|nr:leucyl aminopeptidase [Endozoicomonadaceae bacterium]
MEISVKIGAADKQRTQCLVILAGKTQQNTAFIAVDKATGNLLSKLLKRGDLKQTPGQTLLIPSIDGVQAERILLVATGKETLTAKTAIKVIAGIVTAVKLSAVSNAVVSLDGLEPEDRSPAWAASQLSQSLELSSYRFEQFKSQKDNKDDKDVTLNKVTLQLTVRKELVDIEKAAITGRAIGFGMNQARNLGDLPGNECTPSHLAKEAENLARQNTKLSTKVLGEKEMKKLGMGSFLSVTKGSAEEGKLITMEYKGGKRGEQPIVLLGKGVTFDSGGISLKPGAAMDEMKFDMCGAASVLGAMHTIVTLKLPINVVGMIASAENMPSGHASKPGDIVTSLSGQTIEILNTDAEGRLVLCDALTYAERFKPRAVVDIATLTGACIVALGAHISGLLSNNDDLAEQLLAAGQQAEDPAWRMPMDETYDKMLDSNFADMANIGGRPAGTITAGCFLARYAKSFSWAHLDIAGTAWNSGKKKGSTGRPVPLLVQFLLDQIAHDAANTVTMQKTSARKKTASRKT